MKLRFTPRALADLAAIADYLRPINPSALARVRSAILDRLHAVVLYPKIGRLQQAQNVRKITVRKYGYVIYYLLDEATQEIVVLAVQHGHRERQFTEN